MLPTKKHHLQNAQRGRVKISFLGLQRRWKTLPKISLYHYRPLPTNCTNFLSLFQALKRFLFYSKTRLEDIVLEHVFLILSLKTLTHVGLAGWNKKKIISKVNEETSACFKIGTLTTSASSVFSCRCNEFLVQITKIYETAYQQDKKTYWAYS